MLPLDGADWLDPLVAAVGAGLLAGLALVVPILLWQRRRARALADAVARRDSEVLRAEEVLRAAPDGFYRWDHDGGEQCSRRLAVLLGLYGGTQSGYQHVLDSFGTAEAAVLEVAVAGLRQNGVGFDLELALKDGARRMLVLGVRAADGDGIPLADLLWMRDVTEGTTAVDRLSHETMDLTRDRDRLRGLLDALPVPVWLRDDGLAVRYCNPAYVRSVEAVSADEVVATGTELVPGPLVRQARALAARARAAGAARAEAFHVVVGGQRRLVEISEAPLPSGPLGRGLLTAGIALDQTRQEELQAELTRHVGAHAEVLENLGTAIAIFATDTRLSFHNTAFMRLWRLEADWLAAQPSYGALLDLLRERRRLPEVADWRSYKDEELRRFTTLISPVEDLLHLPDGATLRRVVSPHPFGGLLFTYEDVTDALALERSYNTSLAVQRETLDKLHEGVAVFGGDGRLRLSNPAYAKIWGLAADALAGEPHIAELVAHHHAFFGDDPDWPMARDGMLALVNERQPRRGRLERADGSVLDYASVPLPDGAVLVTWLDVSDSARVERALRERNEALRAADRLKSQFIANVSCEVRTPLNTIIGFSEILTNAYFGTLNPRQMEYGRGITEAGQSLLSLISDILDLATIEAGQLALQLNTFDVHAMLGAVLGLTRERVREKRLTLNFDCPLDIGWIVADERRLKQVLFNLISNAVKFTPAGGMITLAAQRDGEAVVFTVADTGVGIAQAEQPRVFDSFMRGNQPEARQIGAGLGLSLVKKFVELHGGRVEMVSVPGEGTTITVRVPTGSSEPGVVEAAVAEKV